jgi:tripartite-type tricarboxylate transporter receptor subunit TctC
VETVPGYVNFGWYSIVAPKGTPKAILDKASAEILRAVKEPEFGALLKTIGVDLVASGPSALDTWRRDQRKSIAELVKAAGVSVN